MRLCNGKNGNYHSIRNCKSRMDFVGSAVLLLIPIITLEIIGVLKTTISFFVLGNIIIWGIYLFLLWALIRECTSGIVNQNGVENLISLNLKNGRRLFLGKSMKK